MNRVSENDSPAILDGGMGTELVRAGAEREGCHELLSVTQPELVRAAHQSFRGAGATWLTTNTFCADPASLEARGIGDRSVELARASVELCREVAAEEARVFGSVGPGPGTSQLDSKATRAFLECLLGSGVDGLLLETQLDSVVLSELLALSTAAREAQSREVVLGVSLVVDVNSQIPACAEISERDLLRSLVDSGVDCFAFNCSNGPAPLRAALERVRADWPLSFGAYPNAGVPALAPDGTAQFPIGPDEFASKLAQLQRDFDLDLIGGCCGASPEHIRALSTR